MANKSIDTTFENEINNYCANENTCNENMESEDEKEDLQIIRQMKSVNCKVLQNGFKLKEIEFYFCNCDIDQKDPICVECARICHSGEGHILSQKYKGPQICKCGIKRHRVQNNQNDEHRRYKTTCFFMSFQLTPILMLFMRVLTQQRRYACFALTFVFLLTQKRIDTINVKFLTAHLIFKDALVQTVNILI